MALYPLTTYCEGKLYCGLTINRYYNAHTVDITMPGYILEAFHKFQHPTSQRPQHSPHHWNQQNYVTPNQLTPIVDTSFPLSPEGIQRLQQIIGTILYYMRVVEPMLLVALGTLVLVQSKGHVATSKATVQLINYYATHPYTYIRYNTSTMVLYIHSDTLYLSDPQSCSLSG